MTPEIERGGKRTILFPVRIDELVMATAGWAANIRRSQNIDDFFNWKNLYLSVRVSICPLATRPENLIF
jgi:hypothetical protein